MSVKLPTTTEELQSAHDAFQAWPEGRSDEPAFEKALRAVYDAATLDELALVSAAICVGLQIAETRRQVDQAEGSAMEETLVMRAVPERDEEIAGLASAESWRREKEVRHGD